MIETPRSPGELDVSGPVGELLAGFRAAAVVIGGEPELDVDDVRDVEAAIGMHLADDLLAVFAAGVPTLADRFRMKLSMVIAHTGALQSHRARGDLVGVGQASEHVYLCVEKGVQSGGDVRLVSYDVTNQSRQLVPLVDWLRGALGDAGTSAAEPFRARLTLEQPESTMAGRRVRHKKFGNGKALREIGTGPTRKVQVDFPGYGLKLMQARFLEFLE